MLRWYLIRTKPASESLAVTNLDRQGYEVYWPRAIQAVRSNGRWRDRVVSLFPGYVFLHLNEGKQALNPVSSTVGVLNVVRFGSNHAVVPDRVIHDLQARADPSTGLQQLNHTSKLKAGAVVRIRMGPLDGLEGVFERHAGVERVLLLLEVLGQSTSVCVPRDAVLLARVGQAIRSAGMTRCMRDSVTRTHNA
jgi:transcriptional antiterminator RfaH